MSVYHVYVCVPAEAREGIDWRLELQMVVSHHVVAGNRTPGPIKQQPELSPTEPPLELLSLLFSSTNESGTTTML